MLGGRERQYTIKFWRISEPVYKQRNDPLVYGQLGKFRLLDANRGFFKSDVHGRRALKVNGELAC